MKHLLRWKMLLPVFLLLEVVIALVAIYRSRVISPVRVIAPRLSTYEAVAARLPEQRAATRKAGLPLTYDDLKLATPLSPDQNAAPLYREAFADLNRLSKSDENTIMAYLKPEQRSRERGKEVRRQLTILRPALALAEQATRRPIATGSVPGRM